MANRDSSLQIGETVLAEIRRLHEANWQRAREMSVDGIRIGEILIQCRAAVARGDWSDWVEFNLPFCIRQAQRYISYYDRRDQICGDMKSLPNQQPVLVTPANGNTPQQLHESNFWVKNSKLGQTWFGTINHEIKDRPLEKWRRDQLIDLASTLQPFAELYQKLKTLIG